MSNIVALHGGDRGAGALAPRRRFPNAVVSRVAQPVCRNPAVPGGLDAQAVVYRLEEAGTTLLCLPNTGHSTRMRTSSFEVLASALDGTGWAAAASDTTRLRPTPPDSGRIDRMDEALGWLALIPRDRYVLRRIVGARALVSPTTERHLFSWRRLGTAMGADHKAVQRWHAQGVAIIVAGLRG